MSEIIEIIEPYFNEETSQALPSLQKCKSLGRSIKSQRAPPWPSPPTPDLPPRHLADELVDRYLETIEAIYRILHVPSFKRDYDALWQQPHDATPPNTAFLVQLKLVLALGAVTYDDTCSLRPTATVWIYEAQTYLSEPVYKSRLGIQNLQTRVLLLLAQELIDVSGDAVWIAAGPLVRMAIAMGLHRDPSHLPHMSIFQAEMRRRLWNTILEVTLQTSLLSGGPPLLAACDFDAEAPGNFDDEELLLGESAAPRADAELTDTSVARALRLTFPVRLRLAQSLNDLSPDVDRYEDTLRLDGEVRKALKAMRLSLQQCSAPSSPSTRHHFAVQAAELIMDRALSSLHAPFFAASLKEAGYAFSRRVLVDTSLKIWCAVWPSSAIATAGRPAPPPPPPSPPNPVPAGVPTGAGAGLFSRFVLCGGGFFRTAAFRAAFLAGEELRSQLRENAGLLGAEAWLLPLPVRADLLAVVHEAAAWSLRCVEAGEVSVKGCLVGAMLGAHIEGLRRGLGKEALNRSMVSAAEEMMETCLRVLEAMALKTGTEVEADVAEAVDADRHVVTPSRVVEEWDFTVSGPELLVMRDWPSAY